MIGQTIGGKYRLETLLGRGGFASVFAARNVLIDRPVALKILHSTFSQDAIVVQRFLREAKLACRPIHPTILRVEDLGQTETGEPYLVMDLLEGQNLNLEVHRKGRMSVARAMSIATYLLDGLSAAHALGIIHRDVKPANIFLVRPGFPDPPVRILDLGMAKDPKDQHMLTVSGDVIGTPTYLAPEILLGSKHEVWTPAVDVFAAGMVIFLMLTGRLPIEKAKDEQGYDALLNRILFYKSVGRLKGPADICPDVPAPIDAVVRQALAIDPSRRYADARELLTALDAARAHAGVACEDVGPEPSVATLELPVEPDVSTGTLEPDTLDFKQAGASVPAPVSKPAPERVVPAAAPPEREDYNEYEATVLWGGEGTPDRPSRGPVLASHAAPARRTAPTPVPAGPAPAQPVPAARKHVPNEPSTLRPAAVTTSPEHQGTAWSRTLWLAVLGMLVVFVAVAAVTSVLVWLSISTSPSRRTEPVAASPSPPAATSPPPAAQLGIPEPGDGAEPGAAPADAGATALPAPVADAAASGSEPASDDAAAAADRRDDRANKTRVRPTRDATGYLSVRTNVPSRVFLGSRLLGSTPLTKRSVPPGRYTLSLLNPQHPAKRTEVSIEPGETTRVSIDF
jgi:serine/threonine-protein kinase